jgi:hypothetical protein
MSDKNEQTVQTIINSGLYGTFTNNPAYIYMPPKPLEHYYIPKEDISPFELAVIMKYIINPNTFPSRLEDVKLPIFRHFRIPALEFKPFPAWKVVNKDGHSSCSKILYEVGKEYNVEGELIPGKKGIRFVKELKEFPKNSKVFEVEVLSEPINEREKNHVNTGVLDLRLFFDYWLTNKLKVVKEVS